MREARSYRPARSAEEAADELCRQADAGKLPAEAVKAVLAAAGQPRRPVRRPAGLSDRECEVLKLLAQGLPNKRIALQLEISEKTVKAHVTRIFQSIGVTDRTQAALWAREHGIG